MQKKNPGGAPPPPDPADGRMAKLKAFAAAKSRSFSRAMSGLSFSINAGARDYGVYGPDAIELDDLANEAKVPEGVNDVSPEVQQPVHQTVQRRAGQRRAQPAAAQQNRADDRRRQKCLFIVLAILIGGALSGSGIFGVKKLLADKEVIIPGNEADSPDNESNTPDKKADIPPDNEADIPPVDDADTPTDDEEDTPPVKREIVCDPQTLVGVTPQYSKLTETTTGVDGIPNAYGSIRTVKCFAGYELVVSDDSVNHTTCEDTGAYSVVKLQQCTRREKVKKVKTDFDESAKEKAAESREFERIRKEDESSNLTKSSFKITGITLMQFESNPSLKADLVNATQTSFCTATQGVNGFICAPENVIVDVDGPQIPDSEANTPPVKGGPLKKPDVTF
eukprot:991513_1